MHFLHKWEQYAAVAESNSQNPELRAKGLVWYVDTECTEECNIYKKTFYIHFHVSQLAALDLRDKWKSSVGERVSASRIVCTLLEGSMYMEMSS